MSQRTTTSSNGDGTGSNNNKGKNGRMSITKRRERCLLLRDALFACFDKHGIDSVDEQRGNCVAELEDMYVGCQKSWVKFFLERRVWEKEKRDFVDFVPTDSPDYEEKKHRMQELASAQEDSDVTGGNGGGAVGENAAFDSSIDYRTGKRIPNESVSWQDLEDERKRTIELIKANYR